MRNLSGSKKEIFLRRIYESASLVVPDGMPLLWSARLLGTPFKEMVSGSDLFVEFCA